MKKVTIGNATLFCGDCFDVLPKLNQIEAVVTDPPYGISASTQTLGAGKKNFYRGDWDNNTVDLSVFLGCEFLCFWGGNYYTTILPPTNDWLIWHKKNDGRSFSECEMAWTNFNKQTRHFQHHWAGEQKKHPTQKPLAVMRWCIGFIPTAKTILDPFMGSGTTGVAAISMGKHFIGIEREPKYFEIACKRIENAKREASLLNIAGYAPRHTTQLAMF